MACRKIVSGLVIAALWGGAAAAHVPLATAALVHADGGDAGTARILTRKDGVVIDLRLKGIAAGVHGVHLHTAGKCEGPAFTTAGGHLNPGGHQHGARNPAGSHMGDLPNVTADSKGQVRARLVLPVSPQALEASLLDADGAAIVVHAGPDDYLTDPSGNSGGRIACGVLARR